MGGCAIQWIGQFVHQLFWCDAWTIGLSVPPDDRSSCDVVRDLMVFHILLWQKQFPLSLPFRVNITLAGFGFHLSHRSFAAGEAFGDKSGQACGRCFCSSAIGGDVRAL